MVNTGLSQRLINHDRKDSGPRGLRLFREPGWVARMDFLDFARAIFGLALVLGLIGLAAWASRRYAPQLMARLNAERGERRMQVVETLVLDPARRLVLVRVDAEERLILLGEGKELIEPRGVAK